MMLRNTFNLNIINLNENNKLIKIITMKYLMQS